MPTPLENLLVGKKVANLTPEEQLLRDTWNNPKATFKLSQYDKIGMWPKDDPPNISPPPGFLPPPLIVPSLQAAYDRLRRIAPNLDQKVKDIRHDVNEGVVHDLRVSNFNPDEYHMTNLLGTTDQQRQHVTINPRLTDLSEVIPTLGHELTHIAGYGEPHAYATNDLLEAMLKRGWK